MKNKTSDLKVVSVAISSLKAAVYNPRKWSEEDITHLTESIKRFGLVDPIIVNGSEKRKGIVIGGHFRLKIAKDLGYTEVPVVYVNIPDLEEEKELFDQTQKQIKSPVIRVQDKEFAFTKLMGYGLCGSGICTDEKFKKTKEWQYS